MSATSKQLLTHLSEVISLPSVSSADPRIDMSNKPVIDYLANQFSELGFSCEVVSSPAGNGGAHFRAPVEYQRK